jgi:hypothetical protein
MAQIHVQRTLGNLELLRNLLHTELPLTVEGFGGQGGRLSLPGEPAWPPTEAATRARRGQARLRPLPDEVALELGQRPKHVEHQCATARCGIEVFLETLEADATLREVGDHLDEMAEGPSEAIEFPNQQHIALAEMYQRLLQDRPFGTRPTHDLLIDLSTARLAQGIQLQSQVLIVGAHPSIADFHRIPQEFDILVGFSFTKHNQFFEHKDAAQPPRNQEGLSRKKIVRENERLFELCVGARPGLETLMDRPVRTL